jgi:hypothetical protein
VVLDKSKINAKEALEDIRTGMDDVALMKKYKLSGKGLHSLLEKLADAGLIRHLNAYAVLEDIRRGMTSDDLMEKYKINSKGLQRLFQELDKAGLLRGTAEQSGVPSKVFIKIREIAEDIRGRMTRAQLMEKYRLSQRGLIWVSMTLISSGAVAWQDVYDNLCASYEELVPEKPRQTKRYALPFQCPVCDGDDPAGGGIIRDVSDSGLGVVGLKAKRGEMKFLVVEGDEFSEFGRFTFDAQCRWITTDPNGDPVAGFEISHISIGNLGEFKLLLHLAKLGHRSKVQFR